MSVKLGVLASGTGSNFTAIARAAADGKIDASVAMLLSDREQAPVLERANKAGIENAYIPYDRNDRAAFEREVIERFRAAGVDLIILAGFMRLLTPTLLDAYNGRILNIHPSLLPSFKGLNGIGQALEYGVKITGCTVHEVTPELDSGPIIGQRAVEVLEGDDEESLAERLHAAEHQLFPEAIQFYIQQHFND
jgi:phosphoribosylglycinamide formyltransferase-1